MSKNISIRQLGAMASTLVILACAVLSVISGSVAQSTYTPDTQHVYHLFTRENPTVSQPMVLGWPTLIGSNFNTARRTGVLIHGSKSGPTSPFIASMIPATLAGIDANMIAVDWSVGAAEDDYNVLVNDNVLRGAESIARFITWLNQETGEHLGQYHLIGFEVGAHMAALVGRHLNGEVSILTGLSPPSQGWDVANMAVPTDGLFSEAIHTDIYGSGMVEPVANMDFYPNGGFQQPGCGSSDWECNRDRSYLYLAESIRSGGFTGAKCATAEEVLTGPCDITDTVPMGGITNRTGYFGQYYLATNSVPPFSRG